MSKLLDFCFEFLDYATDKGFWYFLSVIFLSAVCLYISVLILSIAIQAIPYAWVVIFTSTGLLVIYTFVKLLIEFNKYEKV